jgi:hypothetical protein
MQVWKKNRFDTLNSFRRPIMIQGMSKRNTTIERRSKVRSYWMLLLVFTFNILFHSHDILCKARTITIEEFGGRKILSFYVSTDND